MPETLSITYSSFLTSEKQQRIWQRYSCTQAILKFNLKSVFYPFLFKNKIYSIPWQTIFPHSHRELLWLRDVFSALKIGFPLLRNALFIDWKAEMDTESRRKWFKFKDSPQLIRVGKAVHESNQGFLWWNMWKHTWHHYIPPLGGQFDPTVAENLNTQSPANKKKGCLWSL